MAADVDLAAVARAIAEPARAAMVLELMDGRAHSARELAAIAEVAPSTASSHLRRLCDAGLVSVAVSGRRRLHRLAGAEVATAVEALAAVAAPRLPASLQSGGPLLTARVCYGHLAGRLGVALARRLTEDGVVPELAPGETAEVRTFDHPVLAALGVTALPPVPAPPVRACLDWSQGVPHLAGALGRALLTACLDARWLRRRETGRALRVTRAGFREFTSVDLTW
ncbi:ArsR/SmtB family transcription factor [Amycolatopsis anabasis]|uniref:ArsR/SmtB family transcription factor n=1 Tax=Amycolatopsis anabasis TaxID=1840409 RepID=UPI00131DDA32|nr:winged helix-turn-helix domain-containing protein [Amycolatopsis anabasis]